MALDDGIDALAGLPKVQWLWKLVGSTSPDMLIKYQP